MDYEAEVNTEQKATPLHRRRLDLACDQEGDPLGVMIFLTSADLRRWGADLSDGTVTVVYTSEGFAPE